MMRLKNKKKGVTLIEIIMSIALLAIVSIPIGQMLLTAVRTSKEGQDKQEATLIGQEILEEIRAKEFEVDGVTLSSGIIIDKVNDSKYEIDPATMESVDGFTIDINLTEDNKINFNEDLEPTEYDGILYMKKDEISNTKIVISANEDFSGTRNLEYDVTIPNNVLTIKNSNNNMDITIGNNTSKKITIPKDSEDKSGSIKLVLGYNLKDLKTNIDIKNKMSDDKVMNLYLAANEKTVDSTGNQLDTRLITVGNSDGVMRVYNNYKDSIESDEKMGQVYKVDIIVKKGNKTLFVGDGIKNLVNN